MVLSSESVPGETTLKDRKAMRTQGRRSVHGMLREEDCWRPKIRAGDRHMWPLGLTGAAFPDLGVPGSIKE